MERKKIAPGVFLNTMEADKFNRCRIAVHFCYPADRATATTSAVLPLVMERGYAECPDMTALSRKLAGLYGADMGVSASTCGGNRILTVDVTGIKDAFALHGENLTEEYAKLALGVAFDPYLENGVFPEEAVAIEKRTLKDRLESEINDKRLYCVRQARRKFFAGSPAGIERDGYLEEVDAVTPDGMKAAYDAILSGATIDVMVQGADAAAVEKLLLEKLVSLQRAPKALLPALVQPVQPVEHYAESMDLVQGKLCMLFTFERPMTPADLSAARLAMSLFGGSPSSRLFLNVREKQSLCYYCGSGCTTLTGCMMVDSGVEHGNMERAEQAILDEWEALKTGPITEEELEDNRRGLLSGLEAVEDTLAGTENWYYMQICRGGALQTPAESREELLAVTADDVRRLLAGFHYSVGYKLQGKEAAE